MSVESDASSLKKSRLNAKQQSTLRRLQLQLKLKLKLKLNLRINRVLLRNARVRLTRPASQIALDDLSRFQHAVDW